MSALFRARYPELVRLADLLGADDPEDIAQEAFARLIQRQQALRDQDAALAYVRSTVCNLVRNRHRHLRVVRLRTPGGHDEASSEHAVMLREDRRELLAALNAIETGSTRSSTGSTPDDWFGYAPSGVARVALRLSDGRQFSSRTIPGWPGSGVVFWGPLKLPAQIAMPADIIVITYDATGHILREVPLIFLG